MRGDFLRKCKARNTPCWLCGNQIGYDLPHTHPDAFNLDHAIPKSERNDLAEDERNFRAAHKICNERRGNGEPVIPIGQPSEVW